MNHFHRQVLLLAISEPCIHTAQVGLPIRLSSLCEGAQRIDFKGFFHKEVSGGSGPYTVRSHLQTSWDQTHWVTVASSKRRTTEGEQNEIKHISALGNYVRAITEIRGEHPPEHRVRIYLVANGRFSARPVTT